MQFLVLLTNAFINLSKINVQVFMHIILTKKETIGVWLGQQRGEWIYAKVRNGRKHTRFEMRNWCTAQWKGTLRTKRTTRIEMHEVVKISKKKKERERPRKKVGFEKRLRVQMRMESARVLGVWKYGFILHKYNLLKRFVLSFNPQFFFLWIPTAWWWLGLLLLLLVIVIS